MVTPRVTERWRRCVLFLREVLSAHSLSVLRDQEIPQRHLIWSLTASLSFPAQEVLDAGPEVGMQKPLPDCGHRTGRTWYQSEDSLRGFCYFVDQSLHSWSSTATNQNFSILPKYLPSPCIFPKSCWRKNISLVIVETFTYIWVGFWQKTIWLKVKSRANLKSIPTPETALFFLFVFQVQVNSSLLIGPGVKVEQQIFFPYFVRSKSSNSWLSNTPHPVEQESARLHREGDTDIRETVFMVETCFSFCCVAAAILNT